jgi:hypothetical protein
MLLYEIFAIGIAVVLVVAAIGGLATRVMMGPEEMALLRLARAAAAQRRLVAAAAQQNDWIWRCLKRHTNMHSRRRSHRVWPHSSLNSKHGTWAPKADQGSSVLGRARREGRRTAAVNGRAMSGLIPLRLIYLRCGERRFVPLATFRGAINRGEPSCWLSPSHQPVVAP